MGREIWSAVAVFIFLFFLTFTNLEASVLDSEKILNLKKGMRIFFTQDVVIPSLLISNAKDKNEINEDYIKENPGEVISIRVGVSFGKVAAATAFNFENARDGLCKFTYWVPFEYLTVASDGRIFSSPISISNFSLRIHETPMIDQYGEIEIDASNSGETGGGVPFFSSLDCRGPLVSETPKTFFNSAGMTVGDLGVLFGQTIVIQ